MSEWSTEWRLYRARYACGVTEDYVARSASEVGEIRIGLVGPDEEAPESVREYEPGDVVTLRGDEGERMRFTADEWAGNVSRPECIASSEA